MTGGAGLLAGAVGAGARVGPWSIQEGGGTWSRRVIMIISHSGALFMCETVANCHAGTNGFLPANNYSLII